MKKRILSMLTAAMMSSTCFFVGAEQICAAEYPSFTLRLNQHTGNAEFMEDETDKKVILTATSTLAEKTWKMTEPGLLCCRLRMRQLVLILIMLA